MSHADVDPIHDAPTQIDAPAAEPQQASMTDNRSRFGATLQTAAVLGAVEEMRGEEVARIRRFVAILAAMFVVVSASMFVVGGDRLAKQLAIAGLASSVLACVVFLQGIRDPARCTPGRVTALTVFVVVASAGSIYFWGVFSPAPAVLAMAVAYFTLATRARSALLVYALCAALQGLLAAAILIGVLADRGLITAGALDAIEALAVQVLLQAVLAGSFAIARANRGVAQTALAQLEKAVRAVSQREALVLEARYELDRALQIGVPGRYTDRVLGSFRLGNVIGRGAMGEIYEAAHTHDKQYAAVKVLHPHVSDQPSYIERFLREAQAASRLDSEHVIDVFEMGDADGVPYMVMERLRGHDLGYYLRNRGRMSAARVVDLLHQVGMGLEHARAAGIVHRDIKPQNLFLAELADGQRLWKILDFGISKLAERSGTLTRGKVVGTPGYMAPEQATGGEVDYRADMFALGVIAYRALTGSPPFSGKDMPSVLYQVVYEIPRRPSSLISLPRDVDRVLALALAKDPATRFETGVALAEALAAAAESRLDLQLRVRGDELILAQPWGANLQRG